MAQLRTQLKGYRLTTAEITYHMPDHPGLLQNYLWQDYDLAPRFPRLHEFLEFWEQNLDGRLHSVRVAATKLLNQSNHRHIGGLYSLH